MKLSVSQLKTYNASPAKWAGLYILWIEEKFPNDAFALWHLAESYLITKQDNYQLLEWQDIQDREKLIEEYDNIKHNAEWLEVPKGINQHKVEWLIFDQSFVGYIDILTDDCVYDIKTTRYLTDPSKDGVNMWSNLSSYDEYALQLWVYMKLTGIKKAKILEVAKHKYKDERNANQILEFDLTDEFDKKMIAKRKPIVQEMVTLYNRHKWYVSTDPKLTD